MKKIIEWAEGKDLASKQQPFDRDEVEDHYHFTTRKFTLSVIKYKEDSAMFSNKYEIYSWDYLFGDEEWFDTEEEVVEFLEENWIEEDEY